MIDDTTYRRKRDYVLHILSLFKVDIDYITLMGEMQFCASISLGGYATASLTGSFECTRLSRNAYAIIMLEPRGSSKPWSQALWPPVSILWNLYTGLCTKNISSYLAHQSEQVLINIVSKYESRLWPFYRDLVKIKFSWFTASAIIDYRFSEINKHYIMHYTIN